MTKRLILMRHAKSGWDDPCLDDHDRVLTERGRQASNAIGQWMATRGYAPALLLSSSSERTHETWAGVAQHLGDALTEFTSQLYLAAPGKMLSLLQKFSEDTVMMLGHNPGTAALAAGLVEGGVTHPKFRQYPSGATTVLDFDIENWSDIQPSSGRLVNFIVPRELV